MQINSKTKLDLTSLKIVQPLPYPLKSLALYSLSQTVSKLMKSFPFSTITYILYMQATKLTHFQQETNDLTMKQTNLLHLDIYLPAVWRHWRVHFIC